MQLIDGDVFRVIVPLDDAYSFDAQIGKPQTAKSNRKNCGSYCGIDCSAIEIEVLDFLKKNPEATHESIADEIEAEIAGGVILILMGLKILLEHLNIIDF